MKTHVLKLEITTLTDVPLNITQLRKDIFHMRTDTTFVTITEV